MAVNVYFLLTLFARTQTQPPAAVGEEPALWLTVQPFIEPDDFETWITTATTPGALTYQLLADSPAQADAAKLVPVPLPPGVSLTLRRLTNMGTTIVGPDIFNDRTGVVIIDPAGFQRDNVNPLKTGQINPTATPYGQAYFDQLTEIHGDPGYDAGVLQQMFVLNFVGGSVRRFRDSTVSDQDKVNLFTLVARVLPPGLSDSSGSIRTVGLVSACGLMLRLDKDIGFQQLRTVDTIELYLRLTTADALPGTRITIPNDEQGYLRAYFAAIDPNNPVPSPSTFWRAKILPDTLTRVYVLPHRTGLASAPFRFATNGGDQRTLFRRDIRRADDVTAANIALLSEIESIGLFYRGITATDPQPAGPPSINIRFYELLEARLVAYRSSTAAVGSPSLWQLVPLPKDRGRFISLFKSLATTAGTSAPWPTQYTIHDRFGFRIEASAGFLETGFVGSYLLPWDDAVNTDPTTLASGASSLPTVLFWFAVPVSGAGVTIDKGLDVTLVVANTANSVAANYAPFEAADGTASTTGGPLWEWTGGTALPDTPWSALDLDASAPISRITPTFIRRGDYVTQPALSAQHTEGVLQVDYPGPPAGVSTVTVAAADVNPVDDFKREMVAYRKLNVYSQDTAPSGASGAVQALNPWSNLFPVWYTDLNGWHRHIFQYRFRSDIYTPTQADAPRTFFADIYSKLGGTRQITLDLEHTTGHAVPVGASPAPVKLTHDAPPTLPSSLRRALRSSQRKATRSGTPLPPLLTVDFVPASNGSSELARVTLDPRYLVPDGTVQTDIDQSVVTAAWRSVAELAYSTTIQLRGQFRRFDFGQAVAAARTVNGPVNLFDGMVPVPPYEDKTADEDKTAVWAFPDTNSDGTPGLRAAARSWLAGGPLPSTPKFDVPLTLTGAPGIAASCHVVEFWIEVVRDPSTVPQRDGQTFVRLPTRAAAGAVFGAAGENVIVIGPSDPIYNHIEDLYSGDGGFVDSVSGKFVGSVDNGWRAISPSDTAQLAAEPFRSLIGSSLIQSQSARAWIVPGQAFEPGDPIVASLLPLGFRTLADRYAGTASYFALCRYMYAVEMMIDAAPGLWSSMFTTASAWQQWFALLSSRSQNLITLVKAASALVVSAYVSSVPNLDPEVSTLIGDWTGQTGGVAEAPIEIRRLMLAKPSLFAESRALLLTRLRAPNKLPPDLLRVQSIREIDPPNFVGGASRLERSTLSLGDTLLKDAGPTALGFIEVLGNEKYDFQFILKDFAVFGIEAFLKSPIPDPSVAPHPLDGPVHVPGSKDAARVDLPSRQPLVSPAHLYTDNVSGMEQQNWALQFIPGADQLSVSGLQDSRTVRKATGGEPALVLRAASSDFVRSTQYDRVVIAGLFYVVSDESNEFENDAFRFSQTVAPELIGFGATTVPTPAVAALFKALEGNSVLTSIDGLGNALDDDTVAFVSKALVPPEPIGDDASYLTVEVSDNNGSESLSAPNGYAAFLFRPAQSSKGPTRHLLVITTQASVWVPTAFSLYHTRNSKPQVPNAPGFNPQLWQFTQVVGDDVLVEFHASHNADPNVVISGIPRTLTPIESVEALLVNNGWLRDAQAGQDWKGTGLDLSIVVSSRHQVSIPTLIAQGGAPPKPYTIVQHGLLPLCNAMATGRSGMSGDDVVFDPSRKDFAVDFTWTSSTNTEILRISMVIVQFDSAQVVS